MNAKIEMANIRDALILADPDGKNVYEANYDAAAARLDALDAEFVTTLSPLTNRDLVVAHAAYGYLCAAYGLNQMPIEGLSPDSEPDPARVAQIIDFAVAHQVKVIFFEELVSPKVAQSIADQVGAKTDVLSPLEGLSDAETAAGDDYFSVMRKNLTSIQAALQ
jgi:zinc transport system substrate-binding protein